jgi:hypothetical protein
MPTIEPANALQANRRTAPRRQATQGTVCHFTGESVTASRLGLVWNISSSGISMLLHEPPERGAVLSAVLATVDEQRTLPVILRIVHVRPIRTGDYFLGAQFQKPLDADEMLPFLAESV